MWRFILGGQQGQVNALAGATGPRREGLDIECSVFSYNLTISYKMPSRDRFE